MPQPAKGARLGSSPAHERLMLANLATSLFEHGRIRTTETKAKRLRPFAERLITKARRGELHHRREVLRVVRDKDVVHKLFAEIGPQFAERPGGYTRIVKTLPRKGDNAPMAIIELITERTATAEAEQARGSRFRRDRRGGDTPAPTVATDDEAAEPAEGADTEGADTAILDTAESTADDTAGTEAAEGSAPAPVAAESSLAVDETAAAPAEGADTEATEAVEEAAPAAASPATTVPQEAEEAAEQADLSGEKDER